MGKTLVCGPWPGEFGVFMMWQAGCRWAALHGDYDKVIVIGPPGWGYLVEDFAEYQEHAFTGYIAVGCRAKGENVPTRKAIEALIPAGAERFAACETF